MIHIIADVHGDMQKLTELIEKCPKQTRHIVLAGDIGFGFVPKGTVENLMKMFPNKFFFLISGNHDKIEEMNDGENYMAITTKTCYAFTQIDGLTVAFIAGAMSPDKNQRIEDVNWWESEQAQKHHLNQLGKDMLAMRPNIIISHDAPLSDYRPFIEEPMQSMTNIALDELKSDFLRLGYPLIWVHGHLHQAYHKQYNWLTMVGIGKDSYITLY